MMRILIAEDEVHLAEAVSQILKKTITPWIWSTTADQDSIMRRAASTTCYYSTS